MTLNEIFGIILVGERGIKKERGEMRILARGLIGFICLELLVGVLLIFTGIGTKVSINPILTNSAEVAGAGFSLHLTELSPLLLAAVLGGIVVVAVVVLRVIFQ